MTGKHDRAFARRRGTSVAACALGLSLVVTGVQPVAAPQTSSQASAQLPKRTDADRSWVRYPASTTVKYGNTTKISPNTNALTVYPPTSYKLADGVNPGWGAEVDADTGTVSITPDPSAELGENDKILVEATFKDNSKKFFEIPVALEPAPVYAGQNAKVFWTGKPINTVNVQVNGAPWASALEFAEGSELPEGLEPSLRNFGNIKHIYIKGTPTTPGTYTVKSQLVENGKVMQGANGDLAQKFTIEVKDSADLPAPVEENIVENPEPVKPGESVDIDIPTENASSVEVTDLPEGLTYDDEKSKITGKPKTSGTAKIEIITNDAKVITDTIDITVDGAEATTSPEAPTTEPTTPEESTTGQATPKPTTPKPSTPTSGEPTSATPTSGRLTTQPAPTSTKPTTAKPTPSVDDFAWKTLTVQAGTTKVAVPSRKPSKTVNVRVDGDAPEWLSVASDGQVVAEPGRNIKPGTYTVDVVSEAGERDTVKVKVTKPVSDADRISGMVYKDSYVQAGKTNSSRTPIATVNRDGIEYEGQPLPAGTKFSTKSAEGTVDPDTGVVTVKAPLRTPAGEAIEVKVVFTYPDGTTGEATAVFHVDAAAQNEAYKPAYQEGLGAQPGKTVVVPLLDGTFPVNKDGENIGQYALAPVFDGKGNELGADKAYNGWDISIDPDTGNIFATAPDENPEPIEVPVTVLYADGTVSDKDDKPTVFARIAALTGPTLADSTEAAGYGKPFFDADGNIRMFPTGSMPPGATFEQTGLTALPVEIDPETGAITVKVSEDAPVGANFDIPLKLTLPDGSVQEITVPVATKSEAANQVVSWRPVKVTEAGTPVTVEPSQAPAGATFALAASFDADGWQASVDPKTGAITAARNGDEEDPQAALIPVVVTFADGSQRVVEVPATTVRGTAALTQVVYPRVVINAGQKAILRPNVSGASFSLIKPVPGLRTQIDPATGELTVSSYDGTVPGPRDIPVKVTFEDSSHTITSARVEVRTKSGKGTLAESTMLNDVSAVGRPDSTTRVTLPVPKKAADQPFSLGEFDADGWEVSLDRARGVLDVHVPANAAGRVQEIPVNVLFADGSTGQFKVSVEVDGVAAGGSSQSNGSSKPSPWVWALAVLGLLGAAGKVLYDNRENFQHFLERWM